MTPSVMGFGPRRNVSNETTGLASRWNPNVPRTASGITSVQDVLPQRSRSCGLAVRKHSGRRCKPRPAEDIKANTGEPGGKT